jgi:starch-binding outer membrane protein, SusD/RagB family
MFAETENELNNGPTAAAYNAVNMVRRRGYGKPINTVDATVDLPSGLSKTAFFNAIVKERALELASEGHRKYDLIRWNLLAQKIAETKTQLALMASAQPPYDVLPDTMFFRIGQTTLQWAGSFYNNIVTTAPSSSYKGVQWVGPLITSGIITNQFAAKFESGKSELLPFPSKEIESNRNLKQNPKY